jgi:hypothetical protein
VTSGAFDPHVATFTIDAGDNREMKGYVRLIFPLRNAGPRPAQRGPIFPLSPCLRESTHVVPHVRRPPHLAYLQARAALRLRPLGLGLQLPALGVGPARRPGRGVLPHPPLPRPPRRRRRHGAAAGPGGHARGPRAPAPARRQPGSAGGDGPTARPVLPHDHPRRRARPVDGAGAGHVRLGGLHERRALPARPRGAGHRGQDRAAGLGGAGAAAGRPVLRRHAPGPRDRGQVAAADRAADDGGLQPPGVVLQPRRHRRGPGAGPRRALRRRPRLVGSLALWYATARS